MERIIKEIFLNEEKIIKIVISDARVKADGFTKIILRPITLKNQKMWQAERFKGDKVYHINFERQKIEEYMSDEVAGAYRQIALFFTDKNVSFFLSDGGKIKRRETPLASLAEKRAESHDRQKNLIINEGEKIPALVDLGVFTPEYKIVKAKYEKYRQINRFVEIIDDCFPLGAKINDKPLKIIDFGCGKSYLTFILYYYFNVIKGINAGITGYDLKDDVIENCNKIAEKYGYERLKFIKSDVKNNDAYDKDADMVVCLHACDTATDYALYYAIKNGVKRIFSVPCCQHEVNLSIKRGGEFDILLEYGLIKERFCALLTDSMRINILQDFGYKTDVIEYIDSEHSLKNVMIRAEKTGKPNNKNKQNLKALTEKYSINQTLYKLLYEE